MGKIKKRLDIKLNSSLHNVKPVLENLLNFITENFPEITREEMYDIKLIFSELIYNAIIHGNKSDAAKLVILTVELFDDRTVSAVVADEGPGFDHRKFAIKSCTDEYLEHGRGVRLVEALCDSLQFNEKGNRIHFTKRMVNNDVQSNNS